MPSWALAFEILFSSVEAQVKIYNYNPKTLSGLPRRLTAEN